MCKEAKKATDPVCGKESTTVGSESREGVKVETVHNPDFLDLFVESSEFHFEPTVEVNNIERGDG